MRLRNIEDLSYKTFEGDKAPPPYAIGSHRWCGDETTFLAVSEKTDNRSEGYKKIQAFCDFVQWRNEQLKDVDSAKSRPIKWLWIDICCIDKRHSAEVAENITSMYEYYENAEECYAYLSDVQGNGTPFDVEHEVAESVWFTRGWTLQELLAPSRVFFVSAEWKVLGHKCSNNHNATCQCDVSVRRVSATCQCDLDRRPLNEMLAAITDVPLKVIGKQQDLRNLVPELICSWVRNRRTTRVEDLAYCLLGLIGVYMLPNYGEKTNARVRLEEEVSKQLKRKFTAHRPEQISLSTSQIRSKMEENVASVEPDHLARLEQSSCNTEHFQSLMARHTDWVGRQRMAELSLRRNQDSACTLSESIVSNSWEDLDQELELSKPNICVNAKDLVHTRNSWALTAARGKDIYQTNGSKNIDPW